MGTNKKGTKIVSHADLLRQQGIGLGQTQTSNSLKRRGKRDKITGMSVYDMWLTRIHSALQWRKSHWNGDENWKRAYKLYGGKHWRYNDEENPSADEARDFITVNITMSTINNMVPFLLNSDPFFLTKPRKPSDTVQAMLAQEIVNYDWNLQQMTPQVKECALDAAIIGHGIAKTGFTFELDQAVSKATGNIVYEDYIRAETPYLIRIDPFNFIYDPTATDRTLATARWAAEIFYQYYDDVIDNSSYEASVRNKIKSGHFNPKLLSGKYEVQDDWDMTWWDDEHVAEPNIVRLFEIWDKKHRKYIVLADGVNEPLIEKDWPYDYLTGFPYRRLDFIKVPNSHYPVGIPYSIEDSQFELDRTRTGMFQHRRRFNRKYEILDNLEEDSRRKLQEGEDGALIPVRQLNSIRPIEDAPLPQDYWQVEAIIKQDVMELSGMDALIRGGPLPSRTTGVEVNTRTNIFRMKIDDLVDRTDRFVLQLGKDVLAHIKANMVRSRVVKIAGLQGVYWVNATAEDIQAELDLHMETVAAPKTNPDIDKQQSLNLLQIALQAAPVMQQLGQPLQINFPELFAWTIEKFGYKDVGRFFQRALVTTPPLQQQEGGENSNSLNPASLGTNPEQPMTAADLQKQFGTAAINNASGLQLGGQGNA